MFDFPHDVILLGIFGFLIAWIGMISGVIISGIFYRCDRRIKGTILGFVGGLILALVCFDLLPESIEYGNIYISIFGIIIGLLLAIILDGGLDYNQLGLVKAKDEKSFRVAIFMSIGIAIHNIPGGIALGTLIAVSFKKAIHLSIVMILHSASEGLSMGFYLKNIKSRLITLLLFSIFTSFPMAIGVILGAYIGNISHFVISISLAFAGGLMLYIVCRELLPESRKTWEGRLSTIGNVFGVTAGILIVSLIH